MRGVQVTTRTLEGARLSPSLGGIIPLSVGCLPPSDAFRRSSSSGHQASDPTRSDRPWNRESDDRHFLLRFILHPGRIWKVKGRPGAKASNLRTCAAQLGAAIVR
jgi:hypothetical protein